MIIDTHSHLSFKAYDSDRDEVIKRTQKEGVVCIDVGTKYETSKRAVELAEKYENIYAAVGMHPIHIKTDLLKLKLDKEEGAFAPLGEEFDKAKYRELVINSEKKAEGPNSRRTEGSEELKRRRVVAVGEIGLDYYYKPKGTAKKEQFKEKQKQVFLQQLELAEELNLPVIVHCRMAHQDVIEILKNKNVEGVIHCFTGNWEEAQKYIDLGFYIGLNGIIFSALGRPASGGKLPLDDVVTQCPLDKILTETDCPYLTPLQENGKRNEPIFVKHVIQKIADLKSVSFAEVADKTTQNAKKLFNI
ncbi:MAG: TatD family hydrolase [Patescibacteria group bacterium]